MFDVAKSLGKVFPELSEEFLFFHLEVRAGKSREEGLRALSDRSPELELKKLVSVLIDGDRYGTSLGPAPASPDSPAAGAAMRSRPIGAPPRASRSCSTVSRTVDCTFSASS